MKDVVITGVGVVSPFGLGREAFWDGLSEGRCAVGPIRCFDASEFPNQVAAEVPPEVVEGLVPPLGLPEGAWRDRKLRFALAAAQEAWEQAECGAKHRGASVSLATGLEAAFLEDFADCMEEGKVNWDVESGMQSPAIRLRSPVDSSASWIRKQHSLCGPVAIHVSACAAGTLAVSHGASLVERGQAKIVLCGGTDSMINPLGLGGMSRLGAPSPRNTVDACRPFDRRRDGLVMGEGAAMFVVESAEHAKARGVQVLARVLGWGSSQDGYKATAPIASGSAAARAIQKAVRRANVYSEQIGYINAHGTGTILNDPAEAKAIQVALGPSAKDIPVSSIKGAIGHLMAAAGAVEIAACLLPFQRGLLPGTTHCAEVDRMCELNIIGPCAVGAKVDIVVKNSFGFGGQNACIVLGRPS